MLTGPGLVEFEGSMVRVRGLKAQGNAFQSLVGVEV